MPAINMSVSTTLVDTDGQPVDSVRAGRTVIQQWTVQNESARPYYYNLWCTPSDGALRYPQAFPDNQSSVEFEGFLGITNRSKTHPEQIEYSPGDRKRVADVAVEWKLRRRVADAENLPAFEPHSFGLEYVHCSA